MTDVTARPWWRWMEGMRLTSGLRIDGPDHEGRPVRYETHRDFDGRPVVVDVYSARADGYLPDPADPATLSRRRGPCPADAGGPMTILFLDFDGVLNDANRKATWDAMRDARSIDRHAATDLLPEYTARVRQIVADTGARVVVCSAWQSAAGMRAVIHAALAGHGIDVYGFTLDYYRPRFSEHGWRWPAIRATVKALRPERWCWLDDEADPSMPESVRVVDGVTDADVARAVAILRGEA